MPFTDPSADLQTVITDRLKADSAIAALIGDRVFDRIPNVPTFPYVSFGNSQVIPVSADAIDAAETFVTLHTWDRFKGFDKSKSLGPLVIAALHEADLDTPGSVTLSVLLQSVNYLRDPDGLTTHGVMTFSILTDAPV
jgi:uncharacterized protein DUF3168